MSDTTKDINRVTGAIIRVSLRLIIYALVVLLLYEGVTAGYSFGYAVFAGTAVSEEPGITASVAVEEGQDAGEVGQMLEEMGLIQSRYIFMIQAMIEDIRIRDYILSLEPDLDPVLSQIEETALAGQIPIIRKETGALLKTLVAAVRPRQILEIGCAVGYSALLMASVMDPDCHITTIEKYEKRIPDALENFRRAGREGQITLLPGDAGERMEELSEESYDFIFMDAAKGQYIHWLPRVLKLLAPGGMLVSDNVLQDGDIVQSRFAVERRNRTIHSRMREYLYVLKHTEGLETAVIPIGDGVTVSVKRAMPAKGSAESAGEEKSRA